MERSYGNRRGYSARRGGGRRPQGQKEEPPMLLGEPSPSLAKINAMNMVKLESKIAQLIIEQKLVSERLEKLKARDPQPEEQIARTRYQLDRLAVLETATRQRLSDKEKRKAAWEAKQAERF